MDDQGPPGMFTRWRSHFAYYIGDIIYGANDGIVTTFAVVSSVAGAGLSPIVVIILGIANLTADGFSMGASRYLSLTSEQSLKDRVSDTDRHPFVEGFTTFAAFVVAGVLPLIPFFTLRETAQVFLISAVATGVSLFIVGAARALVTTRGFFISGLEMLFVGGIAAAMAYGLGAFVKELVGIAL